MNKRHTQSGEGSESNHFGADFDCALQAVPVLEADGVEPAGAGECHNALNNE